jgi:hypothetical protein
MEQSPFSEANSHSASQQIPRPVWKPKVHYRVHKSPPLIPIRSQMHPVHAFPSYIPKIHTNVISNLYLGLPTRLLSGFPNQILYAFLISPMHVTCTAHLVFHYLMYQAPYSKCKQSCARKVFVYEMSNWLHARHMQEPSV